MPNSNPTTTTEAQAPDDGAAVPALAWLSVADAAAVLGVSTRAVQKRAERGTLPARRVQHGRALRWEIDGRKLNENTGANGSPDVRKVDAKSSQDGREMDALTARLLAQLETENAFLRATVEQLHRDGAETRAALREALKSKTPQLLAPQSEQSNAGEAPQKASAPSSEPPAKAGKSEPQRAGAALTYGDIADALEAAFTARPE